MEIVRSHPPRGRGGYRGNGYRGDSCFLLVATIARWWMSEMEIDRSHPPRGRGGYRGNVYRRGGMHNLGSPQSPDGGW
ncbi:MAG: hypothetical protein ACK56G_19360, partial [Pirellulaceae bacterium]